MADDENEVDVFTLTDEQGVDHDFAFLAVVELEGTDFAVLAPVAQLESDEPSLDLFAFVYREVGDEIDLEPVEDEAILDAVFALAEKVLFDDDLDEEADAPTVQ